MTYPNITATDVERRVREIAEADPLHIYVKGESCTNIAHEDSEACLIGRALMGLGVSEALIIERGVIDNGAETTLDTLGIPGCADWLSEVQQQQDTGAAWNDAVRYADQWRQELEDGES